MRRNATPRALRENRIDTHEKDTLNNADFEPDFWEPVAPTVSLTKHTSLTLPDSPKSTLDVVRATKTAPEIPCETYIEKANFDLQIKATIDDAEADSLAAAGLSGLAEAVRDPCHAYRADMAVRFPEFSGTLKDVFDYGVDNYSKEYFALDTKDIPKEDHPPVAVREAIVAARQSAMFAQLEIVRYQRFTESGLEKKAQCHAFPSYTEDDRTEEYALIGSSKFGDNYLLARWGHAMFSLHQLSLRYERNLAEEEIGRQQQLEAAREKKLKKARKQRNLAIAYKYYYALVIGIPLILWGFFGLFMTIGVAAWIFFGLAVISSGVGFIVLLLGLYGSARIAILESLTGARGRSITKSHRHLKINERYPSPRQLKKRGEL